MDLFGTKGFHGCGLNEVLQAADVPKGSFYHHFASKAEFVAVLVARACDLHLAKVRHVLTNRCRTPVARLRALFERSIDERAKNRDPAERLLSKLAVEAGASCQTIRDAARCAYEQKGALLSQVIREAQAAGEVAPNIDADHVGNLLVTWWEGMSIRLHVERASWSVESDLRLVLGSLLA